MPDSQDISIVNATPGLIPGIAAIESQLVSPWTTSQIKDELDLAHGWQFVAIRPLSDTVFGYICGSSCLDEAEIRKFAVADQVRRRGLGRKLLAHSLQFLQLQQIKTCLLELRESNTVALELYSSFGFQKIGSRKSYYRNPCEHAIILKITFTHIEGEPKCEI